MSKKISFLSWLVDQRKRKDETGRFSVKVFYFSPEKSALERPRSTRNRDKLEKEWSEYLTSINANQRDFECMKIAIDEYFDYLSEKV